MLTITTGVPVVAGAAEKSFNVEGGDEMTAPPSNPTRRAFVAAALGTLGSLAGCGKSHDAARGDPGTRIPYGPAPEQFGELRLPSGAGPHPVVVGIHGGFWRTGFDLTLLNPMCGAGAGRLDDVER